VPALLRGVHARVVVAHGRRDHATPLELGEIQEVEGRDARRDAVRRHAGQAAACERERHEVELLDDLICEPCVGPRVLRERREIVRVVVLDLRDPVGSVARERLAFAKHLARDGVERVVVHAHERAAQKIDAVEHDAARDRRLAAAEVALGLAQSQRAVVAPEAQRMLEPRRDPLKDGEIEVDRVPARQYVGILGAHALAERVERRALVVTARGSFRHRARVGIDDQDLVEAGGEERDREQPSRFRIRLDVERQHAGRDVDRRRPHVGILEHEQAVRVRARGADDLAASLDAAFDQVSRREAHVGLERLDAIRLQAVAQAGHVRRRLDLDARDWRGVERPLVAVIEAHGAERASALRVGFADIEMGSLSIVADEERAAVFEPAEEVHYWAALAVLAGSDAIARLQDEAAVCAHDVSLHQLARPLFERRSRPTGRF